MATFKESAIRALGLGYHPFPILVFNDPEREGKRTKAFPLPSWKKYQDTKPTIDEIDAWASAYPWAGMALATGNGLTVLDFDSSSGCSPLEVSAAFPWYDPTAFPCWCVTGGKGLHVYCSGDLNNAQATFTHEGITMDIRGTGGCVVGPGSPVWDKDPRTSPDAAIISTYTGNLEQRQSLPPLPDAVTLATTRRPPVYAALSEHVVIPKGERHNVAASFAMGAVLRVPGMETNPHVYARALEEYASRVLGRPVDEVKRDAAEMKKWDDLWMSAYKKVSQAEGYGERLLRPAIKQSMATALAEVEAKREMGLWAFNVIRAVRVGDLIVLYVETPDDPPVRSRVGVLAQDLFNQSKFKAAYLVGTTKVLPTIKPKSFDAFIQSFEIKEEKGLGVDLAETVKDELERKWTAFEECETSETAADMLRRKGMVKYSGDFLFKLQFFKNSSPALRPVKDTHIAATLSNLGCETMAFSTVGTVWSYRPL